MGNYPHEVDLRKIERWPLAKDKPASETVREWFGYIRTRWQYDAWTERGGRLRVATYGWSGNEDIIASMSKNFLLWSMTWESSHRGGLHIFKLPRAIKGRRKQ